jgi:uncharacterized protein
VTSYLRPGAYTSESLAPLAASAAGIPGEAVGCFAAAYNMGPEVPTLVSSWAQFSQLYGSWSQNNGAALGFAVYSYFNNGGQAAFILRCPNTDAAVATLQTVDIEGSPHSLSLISAAQTNGVIRTPSHGVWGNQIYVEIVAGQGSTLTSYVTINVYYGGTTAGFLVEQWLNVTANPAAPRFAPNIINAPNGGSNYIQLGTLTYGVSGSTLPSSYVAASTDFALLTPTALGTTTPGTDGSSAPVLGTVVPSLLDQYCSQQILMLNVPGDSSSTDINALVTWASGREDVFVFVDGPAPTFPETSAACVTVYTNLLTGGSKITASSYAALHAPYLLVQDPSSSSAGATRYIAPSASVMGAYMNSDLLAGPQQAAAGTQFGRIGALGLEAQFSPTDLNNLNSSNINALKLVPGSGFCVFGARTLLQGYPDMWIPVRRVLMKVEHDLVMLLQPLLFQPNDTNLWTNVTTVFTNYLTQQTLAGLFASANVTQAFEVICDSTNNTPSTAQAGIVNATVGVSLGSPAEIFVINVQQLATGAITTTTST